MCPLFDGLLTETPQLLEVHLVEAVKIDKPVGVLHHKRFGNDECIDFVRLGLADVIFTYD